PALAHAPRQQNLTYAVIYLVRSGVQQVLALEIDFRPTEFGGEPFGQIQRSWPAAKLFQIIPELALKLWISFRAEVFLLQFLERMHQGLGHKPPAIGTEMAKRIRYLILRYSTHMPMIKASSSCVDLRL